MNGETHARSFAKGISYRAAAIVLSMIIVYSITKDVTISLAVGGFEVIAKIFLYYGHERIWNSIKWGKKK